jgi:hypothetical protein
MKFSVPQFIDVEDKIFGQLTLKQGIYIVGSAGITIALFVKFGFFVAVLLGTPLLLLAFLLSFIKIHGQPFINILYSFSFYLVKNKLYLWKKTTKKKVAEKELLQPTQTTRPVAVDMSQSKLRELAWSLDTHNNFDKNDTKK